MSEVVRGATAWAVVLAVVGGMLILPPGSAGAVDPNRAPNCQARIDRYIAGDHSSITQQTFEARVAWMTAQCDRNNAADQLAEDQGVLAPELFPPGEYDRHGTPLACMALDDARWSKHDNDPNVNPLLDPDFPGGMAPLNVPGDFMIAVIDGQAHFMIRNVVWAIEDSSGNIVNPVLLKQETWYNQLGNHTHASIWFEEAYVPTSIWVEIMDEADLAYGYPGSLLPGRVTLSRTWFAMSGCHDKRGPIVVPQILIDHAKSLGWLQGAAATADSHYLTMEHSGDPNVAANWYVSDVPITAPTSVQWTLGHPWFFDDDAGVAVSEQPPSVEITGPGPSSVVRNSVTITVDASDYTDAAGTLDVDVAIDPGGPWKEARWNAATRRYELAWNTRSVADGPHTVLARATDSHGNTGEASPISVRVGNLGPSVSIISPTAGGVVSGAVGVTVAATDPTDAAGSLHVEVAVDGSAWRDAAWNPDRAAYVWRWVTTRERDGPHTIAARATDADGNTATAPATSIRVVNDPPSVHIDAPARGALLSGVVPVTIDANDVADGNRTLDVDVSTDGGRTWVPTAREGTLGRYHAEWDTTGVPAGPATLDVRAVDSDGNVVAIRADYVVVNGWSYDRIVARSKPVAFWRLGETHGTVAEDATAQGHDARYRGRPQLDVPGLAGLNDTAVSFDGHNDRIRVPDAPDLNTGKRIKTYTVELWLAADRIDRRQVVYEQGGANRGLSIYIQNGKLHAGAWNVTARRPQAVWEPVFVSAPITAGGVHHVVMVFDVPSDRMTLYVDGEVATSSSGIGPLRRHPGNIGIGATAGDTRSRRGALDAPRFFDGTLDEVAVYGTALDATTIRTHFLQG